MTADLISTTAAFYLVAAATFVSGTITLVWMRETHPELRANARDDPQVTAPSRDG
ncbi:hypothetical protein [Halostella sp. PRR32]|uniref:hypothetical protein n=1 Tax=Halostella sp. PRR32 TaxID=3098147 RepID=UPI002B1D30CC|nr:hypothetical protein [Halostella sp. PRR32]